MSALVFCSWYSTPYSAYLLYSFSGYHFCGEHFLIYRTAWANATKNSIRIALLLDKIVVVSTRRIIVRSQRYLWESQELGEQTANIVFSSASLEMLELRPRAVWTTRRHRLPVLCAHTRWRTVYAVMVALGVFTCQCIHSQLGGESSTVSTDNIAASMCW